MLAALVALARPTRAPFFRRGRWKEKSATGAMFVIPAYGATVHVIDKGKSPYDESKK